jgi:hypothetical protein
MCLLALLALLPHVLLAARCLCQRMCLRALLAHVFRGARCLLQRMCFVYQLRCLFERIAELPHLCFIRPGIRTDKPRRGSSARSQYLYFCTADAYISCAASLSCHTCVSYVLGYAQTSRDEAALLAVSICTFVLLTPTLPVQKCKC